MLNVIFIVGVIALRHLPTLLNVDVDTYFQKQKQKKNAVFRGVLPGKPAYGQDALNSMLLGPFIGMLSCEC